MDLDAGKAALVLFVFRGFSKGWALVLRVGHLGAIRARSSGCQGVVAWPQRAGRDKEPGEPGMTNDRTERRVWERSASAATP